MDRLSIPFVLMLGLSLVFIVALLTGLSNLMFDVIDGVWSQLKQAWKELEMRRANRGTNH